MAITDDNLWQAERRLWMEGAAAYDELVAPDCVMVFPGIGTMDRAGAIAGIENAPRWQELDISETRLVRFGKDVAVLAYRAEARRGDDPAYTCHCSSTYRGADAGWHLIQHQQTVTD
ncbi:nuclear transport factor 2 family protein [Pelagerythrobacter rhizovicinus]|uniref:Nuclear transport factor 2 family protein n=1 Tax=Pelagerythrobacter rhizovicinus TaxID=2268576 RepID=A0A4Q2KL74_9SPHN|nr:nuclear transport factor 2 family protein [Pelagerythrobacter rhizovicinus]RXZ66074.1 nuclear transport factor 2 family protein [Pelagerythrobacter rhizovicinus]